MFSLPILLVTSAVCATVLLLDATLDLALAKWGKAWDRKRRDMAEWWETQRLRAGTLAWLAAIGFVLAVAVTASKLALATVVHTTKITAHFPFDTRGHPSWGNGTAPTIDCRGSQCANGITWSCTGIAAMSATGTPSCNRATPFYPGGFAGTNFQGVRHDGTNDYWTVADPLGTLGSFRWCLAFRVEDATRTEAIMAQDDAATNRKWAVVNTAGRLDFIVCKGNAACSTVSSAAGALITGATHAACGSYDNSGGDGSAVLRLNTDGVAATAVTTGVSPPQAITPAFAIGARSDGTAKLQGVVTQATITKGSVATAAQLLAFVLAYWGEVGDGEQQVSVTRATTETCQINGADGTIYTMPNGAPCINENGLQVFAAATNLVIRGDELDNAAWENAQNCAALICVAPGAGTSRYDVDTSSNIADDVEDDDATTAECIKAVADCGTTTGTYSASAYVLSVTGQTAVTLRIVTDGTGTATCETTGLSTTAYTRVTCANKAITGTPTSNDIWICPGRYGTVADVAKVRIFGVQCEATANVTPVIRTAGATATRNILSASWALPSGTLNDAGGQLSAIVTTGSTWVASGGNYILVGVGDAPMLASRTAGAAVGIFDGTAWSQTTITSLAGRTTRLHSWWEGTTACATELGVACTTGAYDGAIVSTTLWFGSQGGTANPFNGWIERVNVCRAAGGCE